MSRENEFLSSDTARACKDSWRLRLVNFLLIIPLSFALSRARNRREEGGQVLVIGLIMAIGLAVISLSVANVGIMVAEKIHVQDTVDAAAYSAAVAEARYMNLTAYLNRAMIANYDLMAFNTALWASMVAYDHGIAPIISIAYMLGFVVQLIPIVQAAAPAIDTVANVLDQTLHRFTHMAGQGLGKAFGQDDDFDQVDFNKILEIYVTDVLSTYQGLLYVATQAARHRVAEEVAAEMDSEVITTTVLGLGAETLNEDELRRSVDWIINEPDKRLAGMDFVNEAFDRVMGTDEEIVSPPGDSDTYDREPSLDDDEKLVMLGAVTEASLDKFAAGRNREGNANMIRAFNFADLIPEAFKVLFIPPLVADCIADCLEFWDGCDCDFDVHMTLGASVSDRREDCFAQDRVPVIARQRFRNVNFFGVDMNLSIMSSGLMSLLGVNIPGKMGYISGQNKCAIENYDNTIEPNDFDVDRFFECFIGGSCQDNKLNVIMSAVTFTAAAGFASSEDRIDDHWDGSFDSRPTCAVLRASPGTPCYDETANYISDVSDAGALSDGVPKYDLRTDLNMVGWSHYHYDETDAPERPEGTSGGDENNLLAGPSVAVVGVKRTDKINGLRGMGLEPQFPIQALSRAQVYYQRNPNRPDERPSLFNPHWAARLAPIDSPETPALLKDGLPYVMSLGAPIKPTH